MARFPETGALCVLRFPELCDLCVARFPVLAEMRVGTPGAGARNSEIRSNSLHVECYWLGSAAGMVYNKVLMWQTLFSRVF